MGGSDFDCSDTCMNLYLIFLQETYVIKIILYFNYNKYKFLC